MIPGHISALALAAALPAMLAATAPRPTAPVARLDEIYPRMESLYEDLHRHPELSLHEGKTAATMAERLRALGYEVTTGVGGHGVVGVLRNGAGPTVMLRTDLDALPVEEKTGLPYASRVTTVGAAGEAVPVMHACGHDVHMTSWIGAATLLAGARKAWRGTLVFVGQPAEEVGQGARAMLADGLFTRFPRPDFAFAIHDSPDYPAGTVATAAGPITASADSVDVVVHGRGAHGAQPQNAVDPIVIASRIVMTLQTLVSRQTNPLDPAVVTVGSFHAGTKHNIIPDEARLQLTVRAYDQAVRERLLDGIRRICRAEADAAAAPAPPEVTVSEGTPTTVNDAVVTERVTRALVNALGEEHVVHARPIMAAEDFSEYGRAGIPATLVWVGAADPEALERSRKSGTPLPGLHSPLFAPDREPTLRTGIATVTAAALELLAPAAH